MSQTIQPTLLALKDVQGIQGSFVLDKEGALLAMEMPSLFDAALFRELGPRIERLAECFTTIGEELESCLVRFSDHLLCIKQFPKGGALCILTNRSVNLPALRMAANLAHRRVAEEMGTAKPMAAESAPPAAAAAPPAAVVSQAVSAPPAEHRSARYYRGLLVED